MNSEPFMQVVVEKRQLLADLSHMRVVMREYQALLAGGDNGEAWEDEALKLLRGHHAALSRARVSLQTIDLVQAILRQVLEHLRLDILTFRVEAPALESPDPEPEFATWAAERHQTLVQMVGQMTALTSNAPLAMQQKIRLLLISILNLSKALSGGSREGVEKILNQINLLTSSRASRHLVREIAFIARDIYSTLDDLSESIPVQTLSESTEGISDAAGKLRSVIGQLETAALNNLDHLEKLSDRTRECDGILERLMTGLRRSQHILGELKREHPDLQAEIDALQDKLGDSIGSGVMTLKTNGEKTSQTLLDLVAHQSFQDLTGQTLKKTIQFIESLETQLLDLLRKYIPALDISLEKTGEPDEKPSAEKKPLTNQGEVDQMLADLGF